MICRLHNFWKNRNWENGGKGRRSDVAQLKDKRLVKQEAGNDAKKEKGKKIKREVGQQSEGRNVTAICDT